MNGYVYITDAETTALRDVSVGATVRNPNAGPPWIVVNHSLAAVVVSRWPGRLLRVEILEKASEQPNAHANYTRAVAVEVVEELSALSLLGEHGASIVEILARIDTLTLDEAFALSTAVQSSSPEIYSNAWKTWLTKVSGHSVYQDANHEDTVQIRIGQAVSPVGYAFSLVSFRVYNRGKAVSGPAALVVDAEGESILQAPWSEAMHALLHATLAFGAPSLLTTQEAAALKVPWETVLRGSAGH